MNPAPRPAEVPVARPALVPVARPVPPAGRAHSPQHTRLLRDKVKAAESELARVKAELARTIAQRDDLGARNAHLEAHNRGFQARNADLHDSFRREQTYSNNATANWLNVLRILDNVKAERTALQDRLVSWRTEYAGFASVTSSAFGVAAALIAPYLALNSSLVTQQVELFERSVSALGGHAMLATLLVIGVGSYAVSSKVAPATIYALLKFINGVKDISIATTVYLVKLAANIIIGTIKTVWQYRTLLLTLTFVGLLSYYNPTVNAMVVPRLTELLSQGSASASACADWGVKVALPTMKEAWANPAAYRLPMSLQLWMQMSKSLSVMLSGYMNNTVPVGIN